MAVTAEAVAGQLRKLLPAGAAWQAEPSGTLHRLLLAAGDELARLLGRAASLLLEAHPASISELLAEWEAELGLPLPCAPAVQSPADRRAAIAAKLSQLGGQSVSYFIAVATRLGISITIEEQSPFVVGVHGCGDPVGEIEWAFVWVVVIPAASAAQSAVLLFVLDEIKPAHTYIQLRVD